MEEANYLEIATIAMKMQARKPGMWLTFLFIQGPLIL